MGIISVEQAEHLFWLGRYTERVYTTLRIYFRSFDTMIDEPEDSYQAFCDSIDIPNIYTSREDFLKRYPFDDSNPDSIISNLNRAYDNAIVLRESIGSEALSYIQLAIYDMNKAAASQSPLIEMQYLLDHILSFWGIADDEIDSEQVRNMIKAGKRMERVDLYARLKLSGKELVREVHRMVPRVERSGLSYSRQHLDKVRELVENADLNYYEIVSNVEAMILNC
ncbi:alpha-E domain-containing protein [Roseburia sp. 1XD42-69]|uniref:alpha-E domain-containing protein n=1 Tax=Roseburia sp. 1XD42-69 TaxID=2320088 RepID=UPI000EA013B3|nr:alpha-E domain-containing protein [Roseburia sp. 1XD42-69]RKJ66557.1 hypothetical protein D7Y06_07280 [Roseburia sp. 1XD42-69]